MFVNCRSLTTAPALPATELAANCYQAMFQDCSALITAPVLPAETLVKKCYYEMFLRCSSLNSVTMLATNIDASECLNNWLKNVSTTGTLKVDDTVKVAIESNTNNSAPMNNSGASLVGSGWTVITL
ncbi:MAG: hypothetical protein MJ052_02500 [Sphaerochaetaceae bacterium]|nr:hypothetical protein [Sphaerochaetaceae bacterium]